MITTRIYYKKGSSPAFGTLNFKSIQITKVGSGNATIDIEVSNSKSNYIKLATIELDADYTDGLQEPSIANWKYIRLNIKELNTAWIRMDLNRDLL